jgi:hypothetical protein
MFWNKTFVISLLHGNEIWVCVEKKRFQCVEKYRMLAREVADFVLEPHAVSDVDVIHEHHTGECCTCIRHLSLQVHFLT